MGGKENGDSSIGLCQRINHTDEGRRGDWGGGGGVENREQTEDCYTITSGFAHTKD